MTGNVKQDEDDCEYGRERSYVCSRSEMKLTGQPADGQKICSAEKDMCRGYWVAEGSKGALCAWFARGVIMSRAF